MVQARTILIVDAILLMLIYIQVMSRYLSELLGASEPLFAASLSQLERASGQQSLDVRLNAEIITKVHGSLRALGLDPHDTNGREVYYALQDMVRLHDEFLAKHLGGQAADDVADMLPRIVAVAKKVRMPRQVWVIKTSVAKQLLKSQPPKKLMKALHHRSLESMLKRESVIMLFSVLRLVESADWFDDFTKQYKNLRPSDFERRPVEVVLLSEKKWQNLAESYMKGQHHNVVHSKEMGVIAVLPMPIQNLPGITITLLALLLHHINELRLYSSLFKFQQVRPDFGSVIRRTILSDPADHVVVAGQGLHWRVVHQYFGKLGSHAHPELFEPHVQAEDLEWRGAEEVLFHLEPALQFWQGLDYVGKIYGNVRISFNLIDAAVNFINQLPYEQQVSYHLKDSLLSEIHQRYISQQSLEAQVLRQLDNAIVEANSSLDEVFV